MAVPFVVAMAMFAWGTKVYIDLKRPPADAVSTSLSASSGCGSTSTRTVSERSTI